ncbi:hypothetical protein ACTMTF_16680 [Nonomuraea sp. ZG12]
MAKSDEPPICDTCLGAGGEWIEKNGKQESHNEWGSCGACSGTGRRG